MLKLSESFETCKQMLLSVNAYLIEQDAKQNGGEIDLKNPLARPRIPYEILFAIGGWSAGSPTSFAETYDTRCALKYQHVYHRNFHRNRNLRPNFAFEEK